MLINSEWNIRCQTQHISDSVLMFKTFDELNLTSVVNISDLRSDPRPLQHMCAFAKHEAYLRGIIPMSYDKVLNCFHTLVSWSQGHLEMDRSRERERVQGKCKEETEIDRGHIDEE